MLGIALPRSLRFITEVGPFLIGVWPAEGQTAKCGLNDLGVIGIGKAKSELLRTSFIFVRRTEFYLVCELMNVLFPRVWVFVRFTQYGEMFNPPCFWRECGSKIKQGFSDGRF